MEKISVSDLSIGDWVNQKMNDGAHQVQWIECEMVGLIKHTGTEEDGSIRFTAVPLSFIEPIPLTHEILEKNGLDGAEFSALMRLNNSPIVGMCAIEIKYIHELQHILRLTKTEKEIVL